MITTRTTMTMITTMRAVMPIIIWSAGRRNLCAASMIAVKKTPVSTWDAERVTAAPESAAAALDRLTAVVPDFPTPGILFRDLTPVFADAAALRSVIDE